MVRWPAWPVLVLVLVTLQSGSIAQDTSANLPPTLSASDVDNCTSVTASKPATHSTDVSSPSTPAVDESKTSDLSHPPPTTKLRPSSPRITPSATVPTSTSTSPAGLPTSTPPPAQETSLRAPVPIQTSSQASVPTQTSPQASVSIQTSSQASVSIQTSSQAPVSIQTSLQAPVANHTSSLAPPTSAVSKQSVPALAEAGTQKPSGSSNDDSSAPHLVKTGDSRANQMLLYLWIVLIVILVFALLSFRQKIISLVQQWRRRRFKKKYKTKLSKEEGKSLLEDEYGLHEM